jgi:antirepressor protein
MPGTIVRQTSMRLSEWGNLEIPVLIAEAGAYIPITHVCAILGGLDPKSQRARIHRDRILKALALELPVRTPGGEQDMLCLERLGFGRWLNGIDLDRVRPDIADNILAFQWKVTLEASRILSGEVEGQEAPLLSIVPANRAALRHQTHRMNVRDEDVKRFLLALAARIGQIELSQREMQGILLALANGDRDDIRQRCPQCGYVFGED